MRFAVKPTKRWLVAGLFVAAAALTLLGPEVSGKIRGAASYVLAPFGDGGMYLTTTFRSHASRLGQRAVWPGEARRLQDANDELQGKIVALEGELAEAILQQRTLQTLYRSIPYGQWGLIPARVVALDSLPYGRTRVVNAGRNQGAAVGAQVTTRRILTDRSKALWDGLATISATALVGRIVDCQAFTARLQLVTDKDFRIRAKIKRMLDAGNPRKITVTSGQAAEQVLTPANNPMIDVHAVGDGAGGLIVSDVYTYDNVRPGDWLVTAGDDGLLPAHVRIGKVVEVTDDPAGRGLFVNLRVKPAADLEALREVYVVVPAGAQEQESGGEATR